MLHDEARVRQLSQLKKGKKRPVAATLQERGESAEFAASATGASTRYVYEAERIVEKDASMLERMRDGEITIQEAKRELGFMQTLAAVFGS